jgi:hypothetical protein
LLNTPQIIESKEEITKNIASVLTDEKQILDPSEDEKVNANLYAQFYIAELEELEASFIAGNNKSFDIAYAKLEKRINNIYQIFTIIYTTTSGEPLKKMEGLNSAINILQTNINNKYSVPPKYIESLQSIENTIKNIINK